MFSWFLWCWNCLRWSKSIVHSTLFITSCSQMYKECSVFMAYTCSIGFSHQLFSNEWLFRHCSGASWHFTPFFSLLNRECPTELREAVASIIFSAPRCSDLPDLLQVRNLFAAKYGKEFIAAASELRPDTSVNRRVSRLGPFSIYFSLSLRNFIWYNLCNLQIIEKLSVSAPPADVKLNLLKAIALEYNVNWDSTKTEQEFSKKPEDLLVSISFRLSSVWMLLLPCLWYCELFNS